MVLLEAVKMKKLPENGNFPFSVPVIKSLGELKFENDITIFIGENGTGKSTLLEGIAAATHAITIGGESVDIDESLDHARLLARYMILSWKLKSHRGFFLRAEDFFDFCKQLNRTRAEMETEIERVNAEYEGHSKMAQDLARAPFVSSIAEMESRYGKDLDARSHGESFLKLFQARFVPNGFYILDEPEAPLSPVRQLALITMMKDMVNQGCQFLIATHSPVLMAYPNATILSLDDVPIKNVAYEDIEAVKFMRAFLKDPDNFLRRL
ncbi:MAG TPA: AAA family ATPase [Candidatus Lokiarchaeia archaeon]|nr:AAA family ATPase [Candidatus Lokiarchaeia archaeon]